MGLKTVQQISTITARYSSTASNSTANIAKSTAVLPNLVVNPPRFVLASLRSFPSLEPHNFVPVASSFVNTPLRRDILWKASVHEANAARVGASNPPGRSENGYSRRKVLPQKGSGKARAGDANSPIRQGGGYALARSAPNDYTTDIQFKVYSKAVKIALSQHYKNGTLFIIGGEEGKSQINENDSLVADFKVADSLATNMFLNKHKLHGKNLLFVINEPRENLQNATDNESWSGKIDIVSQEFVEVRDLLRADCVYIELQSLKYLAGVHGGEN